MITSEEVDGEGGAVGASAVVISAAVVVAAPSCFRELELREVGDMLIRQGG